MYTSINTSKSWRIFLIPSWRHAIRSAVAKYIHTFCVLVYNMYIYSIYLFTVCIVYLHTSYTLFNSLLYMRHYCTAIVSIGYSIYSELRLVLKVHQALLTQMELLENWSAEWCNYIHKAQVQSDDLRWIRNSTHSNFSLVQI